MVPNPWYTPLAFPTLLSAMTRPSLRWTGKAFGVYIKASIKADDLSKLGSLELAFKAGYLNTILLELTHRSHVEVAHPNSNPDPNPSCRYGLSLTDK
jgi:hypothetical protein